MPITVKIALKINKTANPNTQGTNIKGFKTIGNPYIIGSAILNIEPAIDNFPKTLNLLTFEITNKTAIGKKFGICNGRSKVCGIGKRT